MDHLASQPHSLYFVQSGHFWRACEQLAKSSPFFVLYCVNDLSLWHPVYWISELSLPIYHLTTAVSPRPAFLLCSLVLYSLILPCWPVQDSTTHNGIYIGILFSIRNQFDWLIIHARPLLLLLSVQCSTTAVIIGTQQYQQFDLVVSLFCPSVRLLTSIRLLPTSYVPCPSLFHYPSFTPPVLSFASSVSSPRTPDH